MAAAYTNVGLSSLTVGDDENASLMLLWTQDLPGRGKRRLAGDVARADTEAADLAVDVARRKIAAQVKSLYADLHRLDRTRIVLEESAVLLDSFVETTQARYESGEDILESVLKARTERMRLEAERTMLDQERASLEIELLAVVGDGWTPPLPRARARVFAVAFDPQRLEASAVERSPELLVERARSKSAQARALQAQNNGRADYTWGAAYGYRGDFDPLVQGMFGVRLPLWRATKQGAAAAQAQHEHAATVRDAELAERSVRAQVRDLIARARRAEALTQLYEAGILPQARSALDAASAAYAVGRTGFMTLLDDLMKLLRYEIESETQKAEQVKLLAALEPLTGEELVVP